MHPARIAEALGLSRPTGELTPLTHQSSQTWTLDTADGRILLKHSAYAWLDHRPLRPDDDIAAWLGRTLAQLHAINPGDHGGPDWYRMHDDRWHTWLGTGGERRWKPALRRHLPATPWPPTAAPHPTPP